jgi:hypothetical protein
VDKALVLIVMILFTASAAVLRNRLVNDFTKRFRGNAHLPADGAGASGYAVSGALLVWLPSG